MCANEISPADGHVVHAEFGCGAHSEAQLETSSSVPVAELVYDDSLLDMEIVDSGTAEEAAEKGTEKGAEQGPQSSSQPSQPSEPDSTV